MWQKFEFLWGPGVPSWGINTEWVILFWWGAAGVNSLQRKIKYRTMELKIGILRTYVLLLQTSHPWGPGVESADCEIMSAQTVSRSEAWLRVWVSNCECYGWILFIINQQVGKVPVVMVAPRLGRVSAKSISLVLFRTQPLAQTAPASAEPGLTGKTSFRILLSLI